jgi:hypothetical protein
MEISELPSEISKNLEAFKTKDGFYRLPRKSGTKHDLYKLVEACKNCKESFLARVDSLAYFCSYKCAKTGGFHPCTGIKRPDNVERWKDNHPMKNIETRKKVSEALKGIKRPYCSGEKNVMSNPEMRKKFSEQIPMKKPEVRAKISGEKSYLWKGGVRVRNLPLYDTYADRLNGIEEVRRDPINQAILQARCKFCNSWFTPTGTHVQSRIRAINGMTTGEQNFYCSDECRLSCSLFNQKKYPKDKKPYITRKDQKELRKMVLERDAYQCQICGAINQELICHHIKPVSQEPVESADIDNCITLCKTCEQKVHKLPGCNFHELKKCK